MAINPMEFATLRDRFRALVSVAESITSFREPKELFRRLAGELQRVVSFDRLGLLLHDAERGVTRAQVLETAEMALGPLPDVRAGETPFGWVLESQRPLIVADTASETRWPDTIAQMRENGLVGFCLLPLTTARTRLGALAFGRRKPVVYTSEDVEFMAEVAKLVAMAVENAMAFEEIAQLKDKLAEERLYLESEIKTEHPFEEIIGDSPALRRVLQDLEVVAAISRTSTLMVFVLPIRSNSCSWSTRSSFDWSSSGISPTSSRKRVPRSATSKRPIRRSIAPVKAPLS